VYFPGDAFDPTGLVLWGIYSDGQTKSVTGGYILKDGFDTSIVGSKTIEIEKYGIPARQYSTSSSQGIFIPGFTTVNYNSISSSGFTIDVLSPTERALVFYHGLTAEYEPMPNRYTVPQGRTLVLSPVKWHIPDNAVYQWQVDEITQPGHTTEYFPYTATSSSGEHTVAVSAKLDDNVIAIATTTVAHTAGASPRSPQPESDVGATKLYAVVAPGQFGSDSPRLGSLHGAGGFGGYSVFTFDHSVAKQSGGEEIKIGGNAFGSWIEPGVIWVSQDDNNNGEPDDTWYELKGSHTLKPLTLRNYAVTYRSNGSYVNNLGKGEDAEHWWRWGGSTGAPNLTELTLAGTLLGQGEAYAGEAMWGYADVNDNGRISLSNAIQADGSPVDLPFIDFLKIVTAFHLREDGVGERSTEAQTPKDRSMADPEKQVQGVLLGDNQYQYTFLNYSGYDVTVEILEGVNETFTLPKNSDSTPVVKTITGKSSIYIDYYGGNIKMILSVGGIVSFYNDDSDS
jgi:hypothetical protein